GMPKWAFTANAQAKVCAAALAKLINGEKPIEPKLINTCYSLVAPDYGIHVAGVYRPVNGVLTEIEGSGGVSKADAPHDVRALEATFANGWVKTITTEVCGWRAKEEAPGGGGWLLGSARPPVRRYER